MVQESLPIRQDAAFEAVIGLEVHVQLRTATKIFCPCPHRFDAGPNTLVCPVCLGYPGALPVLNRRAVDLAVRLALALGAEVQRTSAFARKSYFYPDLPKGYQITQHRQPLALGGRLPLARHDRSIGLERLHLEEDAGKLVHAGGRATSLVDFNRCGTPLVEIVSEPGLRAPDEARDFLETLHRVLRFTGVSDANLEEGSLRCDANVSVRPAGSSRLGTRTEVKNLNSFRFVARALAHEIERQGEILRTGGSVDAETRGFDPQSGETVPLRSKEGAQDYRYFDEPDLPLLVLEEERLEALAGEVPELPWELEDRLASDHGLPPEEAAVLAQDPALAAWFEGAAAAHRGEARTVAHWVRGEVLGELNQRGWDSNRLLREGPAPVRLAALLDLVEAGQVSASGAKEVLAAIWDTDEEPREAVERLGLVQVRDREALEGWVEEVLSRHPEEAARYREGETKLLGFLLGQVMGRSGGRADPHRVRRLLVRALEGSGDGDEPLSREPMS